jgi:tetratricopeptide (TPR) repeat protein
LLDEAITEGREGVHLKNDSAEAHGNLASALRDKGLLIEAIAEYRQAIRLQNNNALTHFNLGNALRDTGWFEKAIAEFRQAIRLKKNFAEAHCNLGLTLVLSGLFAEGLEHLKKGHGLGSKNPRWSYPSAQWMQRAQLLVDLDNKLAAILGGDGLTQGQ